MKLNVSDLFSQKQDPNDLTEPCTVSEKKHQTQILKVRKNSVSSPNAQDKLQAYTLVL